MAIGLIVALAVSAAVAGWMVRIGPRFGVVDLPDSKLKTHRGAPVPLGGVALMAGLHLGMWQMGGFSVGLFAATAVVFVIGLVDDVRGLTPAFRLVGVALAGALLPVLTSDAQGALDAILVVILGVVLVNAINLFDGLDTLASTIGALAICGVATIGWLRGVADPWLPLALAAALIGVLIYNWPPARLYLGDNGAYVLGMTLAWSVTRASPRPADLLVAVAIVGMPLLDMAATVLRRLRSGAGLFIGDRDHVYDVLVARTGSVLRVVAVLGVAQVVWMSMIVLMEEYWGVGRSLVAVVIVGAGFVVRWSAVGQGRSG